MEETTAEKLARAQRYRNIARMVTDSRVVGHLIDAAEKLERDADRHADENGDTEERKDAARACPQLSQTRLAAR